MSGTLGLVEPAGGPGGRLVRIRDVRPYGGRPVDLVLEGDHILGVFDALMHPVLDGELAASQVDEVDGGGAVVLPAFVDLHTHLREPGGEASETIASGMRAAAAGGYATVFAMANTTPVTDTAARVRDIRERAGRYQAACPVEVVPIGAVTHGLAGQQLADLGQMADAGVHVFSDDGHCVDDADLMRRALQFAAETRTVIAQHAQSRSLAGNGQIDAGFPAQRLGLAPWPASAEAAVIARDAVLAAETGGHLHVCHVSTALGVQAVAWAKEQGWPVTAEATPHHLLLSDDLAALGDARFKVNPPLRTRADVAALRAALTEGIVDAVATDHAPHTAERKSCAWHTASFGMTGLETALSATAQALADESGRVDWRLVSKRMTAGPAAIGGLATDTVPEIAAGAPADLVLVDATGSTAVEPAAMASRSQNTPFPGIAFAWSIAAVYVHGRRIPSRGLNLAGAQDRPCGEGVR